VDRGFEKPWSANKNGALGWVVTGPSDVGQKTPGGCPIWKYNSNATLKLSDAGQLVRNEGGARGGGICKEGPEEKVL